MKTLKDAGARGTVIGIGAVALFAFVSVAGATECEQLDLWVAEVVAEMKGLGVWVCELEAAGLIGTEELAAVWDETYELEDPVMHKLSTVLVQLEAGGNKAAGTRVRKQMQQIKQAAQAIRNRILEIRPTE